ncbi:MAG: class I SAM-dependent methyltransferase [Deltaproteobacteria bacterium]|jgi:SAM-dependent methyltransferase
MGGWGRCPACDAGTVDEAGRRRCPSCGHRTWALSVDLDRPSPLDDVALKAALSKQRRAEFHGMLAALGSVQRIVDVGCSTGEFLDVCCERGIDAVGVEPDPRVAEVAQRKGHDVREGFFDAVALSLGSADVVVFNDVLEHIPDAEAALRTAKTIGSRLAISLPNGEGAFYSVARLLESVGRDGPMRRLWQADYPSPHVHYFTPRSLRTMARRAGWAEVSFEARVAVDPSGVWERVRADRSSSVAFAALVWGGVRLGWPVLRRAPKDISVHVFTDALGVKPRMIYK